MELRGGGSHHIARCCVTARAPGEALLCPANTLYKCVISNPKSLVVAQVHCAHARCGSAGAFSCETFLQSFISVGLGADGYRNLWQCANPMRHVCILAAALLQSGISSRVINHNHQHQ